MAQVQPAVSPIQTRFDGGEVSPRLSGRFDSELYKKALRQCSNFEPLSQGSLRMRSGSEKVQPLTGDLNTRLAQIRMSTGQDFLVELIDHVAHLYSLDNGISSVQTVRQAELIANGDFTLPSGAKWNMKEFTGGVWVDSVYDNGYFVDGTGLQLNHAVLHRKSNAGPVLYQRIVVPSAAQIHIQADVRLETAGCLVKLSTTEPVTWADTGGGGETWSTEITNLGGVDGSLIHRDFGTIGVAAGVYYLSFQVTHTIFSAIEVDNISSFATFGVAIIDIPSPWSMLEVGNVKYATETGRDRTIFVHPSHSPWFLLYGGQPGNWTFGNVAFTSIPSAWGDAGSANVPAGWNWQGQATFLAEANWPSSIDMHDGRIYYAGEPAQKNRIVASRSGSGDDFTIGANPGDALDFKLATKGAIRWLRSNRVMLAGTDLGQHSITGSKGTPLVGDIQARQESAFPSSSVQALAAGTKALYVSSDLRRVRAAAFDFQTNGWESKDVTFASEHITADLIKELHFAWAPDSMVIALLKSGKFAIATFEPTEQVTAWWTIDIGGTVVSASVSQGSLGAYLWAAVLRADGVVYLEKIHLSESTEVLRYLDTSIAAVADGNGAVAGLMHLNLQKVRVVAQGGGLLGDFQVEGGSVQLGVDNAGAAVFAGLPYLARAVTLPRDIRHGKAQSSKLGVILNNSALPKLNGKRSPERKPATPMGNANPPTTGKAFLANLGWSDEDSITIEQDLPFRTEVCALFSVTQTEQGL